MANEKVTQMVELPAGDIAANDLFLLIDTSAKESKKIQASSFVDYIVNSASFNSVSASFTDSSSYVNPAGVGLIASASYAIRSTTASYAHITPSAETASYALISQTAAGSTANADTASFLKYTTNVDNGTASFSITSSYIKNSQSSSFLVYVPGLSNGTSSWSITSSFAQSASNTRSSSWTLNALTASHFLNTNFTASFLNATASQSDSASYLIYYPGNNNGTASYAAITSIANTASYVSNDSPNVIKAWATLYWMNGTAITTIYKSYNIASVDFLDDGNIHSGEMMFTRWKVVFEKNLPSINYTLIGTVQKYYGSTGLAQRGDVLIYPDNVSHPKYITGFTMSMGIPSDDYGTWFTANKNVTTPTWEGHNTGSCHFMIMGLPG